MMLVTGQASVLARCAVSAPRWEGRCNVRHQGVCDAESGDVGVASFPDSKKVSGSGTPGLICQQPSTYYHVSVASSDQTLTQQQQRISYDGWPILQWLSHLTMAGPSYNEWRIIRWLDASHIVWRIALRLVHHTSAGAHLLATLRIPSRVTVAQYVSPNSFVGECRRRCSAEPLASRWPPRASYPLGSWLHTSDLYTQDNEDQALSCVHVS